MIGGPLTGGCFVLQFYAPRGWGDATLLAFWWVVQVALNVALTLTVMAYQAMAAELTPRSSERLQLMSLQQGFGVLGGIVGPSITLLLVDRYGGHQSGFTGISGIYGAAIAVTFVTVFLTTRPKGESTPRIRQPPSEPRYGPSYGNDHSPATASRLSGLGVERSSLTPSSSSM